jgi:benzoyl-CoA-dihydrodiol lyase
MFSFVRPGSCFAGMLAEVLLASDRGYMLQADAGADQASMMLSEINFGALPTVTGEARIVSRLNDETMVDAANGRIRIELDASEALSLGLVTATPDTLDWDDEVRQAIESRIALSPDALTGMEANLRFSLPESQNSRVFARLSAWQNWIFIRPNAVGKHGALKVYGSGAAAKFDWERV